MITRFSFGVLRLAVFYLSLLALFGDLQSMMI